MILFLYVTRFSISRKLAIRASEGQVLWGTGLLLLAALERGVSRVSYAGPLPLALLFRPSGVPLLLALRVVLVFVLLISIYIIFRKRGALSVSEI